MIVVETGRTIPARFAPLLVMAADPSSDPWLLADLADKLDLCEQQTFAHLHSLTSHRLIEPAGVGWSITERGRSFAVWLVRRAG